MRRVIVFGRVLVPQILFWSLALGAPPESLKPVFPGTSTLRGTLKSGGAPVNGPVEVRVQLYDAPTGGNPVTKDPVSFTTTAVNGDFSSPLDVFRLAGGDAVSIRDCFRGAQNGFLQISVRRPGEVNFSPLSPRQSLGSIPLSLFAGNAINAERASVAEGVIDRSLLPSALQMAPNAAPPSEGQILSYRNGGFVWTDSIGASQSDASGSVGLNLGSLASFRFQSGNAAVFPAAAPSLIAGVLENRVSSGTGGNVIAGGGLPNSPNSIDGNQNFIGSGILNTIGPAVDLSAIVSGSYNLIQSYSSWSFIGAGRAAIIETNSPGSFVGAAANARVGANSPGGVIVGGRNAAIGIGSAYAAIVGGNNPSIGTNSGAALLGGGDANKIGDESYGAVLGGGTRNQIQGVLNRPSSDSVLVGGLENTLSYSSGAVLGGGHYNGLVAGLYSVVVGGFGNNIRTNGSSVIAGGANNLVEMDADYAAIGGGQFNRVHPTARWTTIPGGYANELGERADYSSIAGGKQNVVTGGNGSAIGGGENNSVGDNAFDSVIAGGANNRVEANASGSVIAGGGNNKIRDGAAFAVIPGGGSNEVGIGANYSFVGGNRGTSSHYAAFVWSDGSGGGIASSRENQVTFQGVGGIRMITGRPASGPMVGAELLPGSGSWSSMSDRNAKTNVATVDPRDILDRVARLPIGTWNYRSQDETVRHIGPMAQDFRESFGLGEDDRHISAVDADGVALAAIQGLHQRLEEQRTEIERKDGQVTDLQKRVAELESMVRRLVATRSGGDR